MTASREKATTPLIYTNADAKHFRLQVRAKIPMAIKLEYGDMARILGPEVDVSYPRRRDGGFVSHEGGSLNINANGFQFANLDPIVDTIDDIVLVLARVIRMENNDDSDPIDDTIFIIGDDHGKVNQFHRELHNTSDYMVGLVGSNRKVYHVPVGRRLVDMQEYALGQLRKHYQDIRKAGLVGPISTLWAAVHLWKEHDVPILLSDIGSPKASKNTLWEADLGFVGQASLPDELYWDELIGMTGVRLLVDRTTGRRHFMDRLAEYEDVDANTISVLEAQANELENIAHSYRLLAEAKKRKLKREEE